MDPVFESFSALQSQFFAMQAQVSAMQANILWLTKLIWWLFGLQAANILMSYVGVKNHRKGS